MLAVLLGAVGPAGAYRLMAPPARWLYRLLDPVRRLSEAQCAAALPGRSGAQIRAIAEQAFVHRVWNLVDLMLAPRLLRASTIDRYGGRIPDEYLRLLREASRRRTPVILLTGYYGPYDLLPLLLGYNGVPAVAVQRRHPNPDFDRLRAAVRARSGVELVTEAEAVWRLPQTLEAGGVVALLADHHEPRRGVPVTFLNQPTAAPRSVGLLAARHEAVVVVAGVRRLGPFRFELVVADWFGPADWREAADPVALIARRYVAALERIVLARPEQYLWAHPRWPRGEPG